MTLPSAPASIGIDQINAELGLAPTTTAPINDAPYRGLAGLPTPTSQISWSNFYGKTSNFSTLANCYCGGWYMGCTTACGQVYYLLAAPATPGYIFDYYRSAACGCAINVCAALPVFSPSPGCVCIGCNPVASDDGYCLTKFIQTCPAYNPCYNFPTPGFAPFGCGTTSGPFCYPMFTTAIGFTINGFSDWYIPAATEMATLYYNTDSSWRCGGPMKTTGNHWPICGVSLCASGANAPGAWPYLGYLPGIAPFPAPQGCGWGCGNPWIGPLNPGGFCNPACIPQTSVTSATQASGQPTGLMPTSCGILFSSWLQRFWCSGIASCSQGIVTTPTGTVFWCAANRCAITMTRAVRRVLKV